MGALVHSLFDSVLFAIVDIKEIGICFSVSCLFLARPLHVNRD